MMGFKIKVLPGKTFRMNLPTCKNYNSDFDGDEIDQKFSFKQAAANQVNLIWVNSVTA